MTSQNPATPVKVPPSAANYTNATLDPDLRSHINHALMKEGLVTKIQEHLLHSLNSNSSNWPTTIQNHALNLLRSGEVTTFPALLRRVIEDVRQDTAAGPSFGSATNGTEINGKKATNGTPSGETNGTSSSTTGLAVPHSVVEDALKVTRESLESVCSFEENGA
ncbi:hypothetical protein B0T16DRAFT_329462 [Cercophora newfieldiana]|uniref:Uncharacterized protein n=1 Tax=Cercophora newfieldiana TaxID=92897 RepID=A0AA40CQ45_9PEZI|nr:hypothetical protein B0T16DRAFT_329462 [Cercophora newfieldiana]